MSADLDRRISAALHRIVDTVPSEAVSPSEVSPQPPPAARRRLPWLQPVGVFAAVALVLVAVAVLPGAFTGDGKGGGTVGDSDARAVLPARFAGMSPLTASVSDSPPGRAIAIYKQGSLGTQYLGTRQFVVVGADGRTYRRLDAAERRGVVGADGEFNPANALLAPDGGAAVVADAERATDTIELVDLRTGKVREYRLDPPAAVQPLAWSADSRRLAIVLNDGPLDGSAGAGRFAVLDVASGAVNRLTLSRTPSWDLTAAFSPDGNRLAVTVDVGLTPGDKPDDIGPVPSGTERAVAILDLTDPAGAVVHTIALPKWHSLAGSAAWSPDGALLVAAQRADNAHTLAFLDATGEGRTVPASRPLPGPLSDLLGWRSPDVMLIGTDSGRDYRITETPVRGGEPRTVSRLPQGVAQLARVDRVQLASALVSSADVAEVGRPERGPWPLWWRIVLFALIMLAAGLLFRQLRNRRKAVRQ